MASTRAIIVAALLAAVVCGSFVQPASADVGGTLRWCLITSEEGATCQNMTAIFERIDPYNHTWTCVTRASEDACIDALAASEADFVSLDSGDVYSAYNSQGAIVVAQEQNAEGGPDYWAVAVAREEDCKDKTTLQSFKGKNSCHTGYRRASGWFLPVWSFAVNSTKVPVVNLDPNVNNDIETVENFFGSVCAPGSVEGGEVCSLCPNACNSDTSTYVDYQGAINCLMNGGGDIAFTKHDIPEQYASDGVKNQTWSIIPSSDMKLLCPQGGCADLSAYKTCNWGFVKGHAIITRKSIAVEEITEALKLFTLANSDPTFVDLFFSGKNVNNYIFKADTQRLAAVYPDTAISYLGNEYNIYKDVVGLDTTVKLGTGAGSSVRASFFGVVFAALAVLALW